MALLKATHSLELNSDVSRAFFFSFHSSSQGLNNFRGKKKGVFGFVAFFGWLGLGWVGFFVGLLLVGWLVCFGFFCGKPR